VRYRENNGKQVAHRLASVKEYPRKSEVKELKREFMAQVNRTADVPTAGSTVGEFVEGVYWTNIEKRLDPSTVSGYRKAWQKHLAHHLADRRVRDVRPVDIQQIINAIAEETTLTKTTYRWLKVCMSAIFSEAVRCGLILANPVRSILTPKGKRKRRKTYAYSLDEIQQHFAAFAGEAPIVVEKKDGTIYTATISRKMIRALVGVAAYAALRQGEVRGLMKDDDLGDVLVISRTVWETILKDHTKTGEDDVEPGVVPIIPQLRDLLDSVKPEYGFFFVGQKGGIIDLENLAARTMKPYLQAHGLKWHGWHAYRRGLATSLHDLGIDDITIQAILRHQDVATTRRSYIKSLPKQSVEAMEQFSRLNVPRNVDVQ
jgi:integrase